LGYCSSSGSRQYPRGPSDGPPRRGPRPCRAHRHGCLPATGLANNCQSPSGRCSIKQLVVRWIGSLADETIMGRGTDGVTTGSVVSADGTRIGYRRLGRGPSVILLHGGVNASQHMMKLGRALADAFTVYLPDRRGRGMSGGFGPAYSIQREDEDLAALVEYTGAECVFGSANGGLFALHAAIGFGQIRRAAAYEPLVLWGGPDDAAIRRMFTAMQQMIRSGRMGEAIVFSIHEGVDREVRRGHMSRWVGTAVHAFPSRVGAGLIELFLRYQRPHSGTVAWRELVGSLPAELDPVLETEGTLEQYRQLDAQVLLIYGSETDPMFVDCAEALHAVLPHSTVLRLPGLNHDSAQTYGKPETIAAALRLFFGQ
jgi:pimeloyl-ACP methyl ester carboxylesterase